MKKRKVFKRLTVIFILLLFFAYSYYNYLSYDIYINIEKYEEDEKIGAVKLSRQIINEKYPYSIFYFLIN